MKEIIEPFIILPYGELQDIVFFINESIRNEYAFLVEYAYKELSNDILSINLIKVINKINEIIIFHIYPTTYEEKYSGRKGQNLIVGYIINKKCFCNRYDNVIYSCNLFFNAIRQCSHFSNVSSSIPTKFLSKVNMKCYNDYINNYLSQARIKMIFTMKEKKDFINDEKNERLKLVYDFIKRKMFFVREYWIVIDLKESGMDSKKYKVYNLILKE